MNHRRLRERLAHYRTGAGPSPVASGLIADDPWPARVNHLRTLVQARRRRLRGESLPNRGASTQVGEEIAPGIMLLKTEYAASGASALPLPTSNLPEDWGPLGRLTPLLVFDTETTGLGSGAGQWVWMVGLLSYQDQRWTLSQWWLSRPGAECLFLEAVASAMPSKGLLLSYNGRSFDVPMLRTRHQMHGMVSPFENRAHWDLLLTVRRFYRGRWADCRLATVERELLGRGRVDDLPGSMAPQAWRDYLRTGATDAVAQVLTHNRIDLESLVYLLRQLCEPDLESACGAKLENLGSQRDWLKCCPRR